VETRRLVLRCWEPRDVDLADEAVLASLEHLRPWMPWAREEPRTREASIELLRRLRAKFDFGEDFVYAIFDRQESRVLGGTGLHMRAGTRSREIGYWIRADAINQGLATEAAGALTKIAFEVDEVERVAIRCDVANVRSARVPAKLGFTHEATLRRAGVAADGSACDEMVWALLADEYTGSPSAAAELSAFDALGQRLL
jgi:RimJ/RimL family protein N-acetyltransferase